MTIKSIFLLTYLTTALPPTISQSIENPSVTQCLAAPCDYVDECRSGSNVCGAGSDYCNELSIWVPKCGGGGTLQRDEEISSFAADTTANNGEPTTQPTTAWDAWTNSKNEESAPSAGSSSTGESENQGVIGYTTGNESGQGESWNPDEQVGWFDPQGWMAGNRTNDEEEEESLFDKYNPFAGGDEDDSAAVSLNRGVWWSATVTVLMAGIVAL